MNHKKERTTAVIFSATIFTIYFVGFFKPLIHTFLASVAALVGGIMPHFIVSENKNSGWRD